MHSRTALIAAAIATLGLSLQGCSDPKKALGLGKRSPDEFAVVTRAPLSLPPEYALRPPQPGAQRPQELSPVDAARQSLFSSVNSPAAAPAAPAVGPAVSAAPRTGVAAASLGSTPPVAPRAQPGLVPAGGAAPAGPTPGDAALIARAGADRATPNIRAIVDEETSKLAQADRFLVDRLIFWKDPQPAQAEVVNPVKETQRLQENAALGKPPNEGEVPVIKRKTPSLFERLF